MRMFSFSVTTRKVICSGFVLLHSSRPAEAFFGMTGHCSSARSSVGHPRGGFPMYQWSHPNSEKQNAQELTHMFAASAFANSGTSQPRSAEPIREWGSSPRIQQGGSGRACESADFFLHESASRFHRKSAWECGTLSRFAPALLPDSRRCQKR